MASHFFIVFCLILFLFIAIYTFSIITFEKRIINFRVIVSFLKNYSFISWILLLPFGIFIFLIFGIIKSDFFLKNIKLITTSGLGSFSDFFNGLVGPIVSIISIIYIYKAFEQQYKANEMIYKFEFKRNIKENLDWLRNNSDFLKDLEYDINKKNRDELENYLIDNTIELNKLIYTINVFKNIFKNLTQVKDDLNFDTIIILNSFYLKSYKSIFRDINNYISNSKDKDPNYLNDLTKIEIEFASIFISLYDDIKQIDTEKTFIYTITEVKKNIGNGK